MRETVLPLRLPRHLPVGIRETRRVVSGAHWDASRVHAVSVSPRKGGKSARGLEEHSDGIAKNSTICNSYVLRKAAENERMHCGGRTRSSMLRTDDVIKPLQHYHK